MADRMADASGGIDGTGGGQIGSRGGDLPALPSGATSVTVAQWPPANWGPKLYRIDTSGNRIPAAKPGS
jgi:hypothetical protein